MKERPILFSGPMVRAILDGRKTQTRRALKPSAMLLIETAIVHGEVNDFIANGVPAKGDLKYVQEFCPYGQPGDRLWVKETYSAHGSFGDQGRKVYRADLGDDAKEPHGLHWRPSIFCTRKASRITLEITSVRVERLNDISDEDAKAEGVIPVEKARADGRQFWRDYRLSGDGTFCVMSPQESYRSLWEQINGAGSWEVNPWVWVIEFRRL
jgi:hypothetical protein